MKNCKRLGKIRWEGTNVEFNDDFLTELTPNLTKLEVSFYFYFSFLCSHSSNNIAHVCRKFISKISQM